MCHNERACRHMLMYVDLPQGLFASYRYRCVADCVAPLNNNNNNMQFLYSAFSLLRLAQSALHIITQDKLSVMTVDGKLLNLRMHTTPAPASYTKNN